MFPVQVSIYVVGLVNLTLRLLLTKSYCPVLKEDVKASGWFWESTLSDMAGMEKLDGGAPENLHTWV